MKHSTIIFLGPTLTLADAKNILPDAHYLPPICCGDILQCLQYQPKRIGIIDGSFEYTAAVWHKEILLALEQGVSVLGASSMGALRAAELAAFGMVGIGSIYEDFATNILEDDDEVAVIHRNAQSGYEAINDAMVNIRATLNYAVQEKVIDTVLAEQLINHAKAQYYQHRSLEKTLKIFAERYDLTALNNWLKLGNFRDQKRLDAIALLTHMKNIAMSSNQISVNKTVLLHKLNDRFQCEPLADNNNPIKKYLRLFAYAMKTGDRLRHLWRDESMNFLFDITPSSYEFVIESSVSNIIQKPEIKRKLFALARLFKLQKLLDLDIEASPNVFHKQLTELIASDQINKIMVIVANFVYVIDEILINEHIALSYDQEIVCAHEIIKLIGTAQTQLDINDIREQTDLMRSYFILRDILNQSADLFLAQDNEINLQSYYDHASLLCQL